MNTTARTLVVCLIVWLAVAERSDAQMTNEDHLVFDAADVHPSAGTAAIHLPSGINSRMRVFIGSGRYELRTATVVDLIATAYRVGADKVSGGPSWLDTDRFDVIAKVPAGVTAESLRRMLQALLADRFRLVVHHDTKPFPGFALTAGKHPLLKEATGEGAGGCQSAPENPQSVASDTPPRITFSCRNMTMVEFANRLPQMAGNYISEASLWWWI